MLVPLASQAYQTEEDSTPRELSKAKLDTVGEVAAIWYELTKVIGLSTLKLRVWCRVGGARSEES